jgi:hypothetical protein
MNVSHGSQQQWWWSTYGSVGGLLLLVTLLVGLGLGVVGLLLLVVEGLPLLTELLADLAWMMSVVLLKREINATYRT